MIYDEIKNINLYFGLSEKMDIALKVLANTDFADFKPGTYFIGDSGVFYNVMEPCLENRDCTKWEIHDKYIDIQCSLCGGPEIIDCIHRGKIQDWRYEPGKDIAFSEQEMDANKVLLEEGNFAVFFPDDAHRPNQGEKGIYYRKVVLKVPVTKLEESTP